MIGYAVKLIRESKDRVTERMCKLFGIDELKEKPQLIVGEGEIV